MSQDQTTSTVCSSAEVEDWLAMELKEENGCRGAAVAYSVAHARPILSLATIAVLALVLSALVFG
jgi:hypothetical protein